jgi:hypothetical protein
MQCGSLPHVVLSSDKVNKFRVYGEHQVHRGSDSMKSCKSPLTGIVIIFSIIVGEMEILYHG